MLKFTKKGRSQAEKQRTGFCKARLFKARESNSAVSKKLLPFLLSHFPRTNKNPTTPSSPSCTMHVVDPTFLGGPRSHLFPVTTCPLLLPVIVTHHYLSQAVLIATCTPPCIHMHVHTYIAIDRHDIIPKSRDPSILDLLHD